MVERKKKTPHPVAILVSRTKPATAALAVEIDRLGEKYGESCQSIGLKAVRFGLAEVEKVLSQIPNGGSTNGKASPP